MMRLDLRFSDRPLENLWCQAVVALVFQRPYLSGGVLSGLNEKMAGFLTYLEEKGFWTGTRGETILLASQNMINADKILLKGLGRNSDYDTKLLVDRMREVSSILDKIEINEFGIYIPTVEGLEAEYPAYLELSVLHLVDLFLEKHGNESDFLLKIIFSVERYFTSNLKPIMNRLRDHFLSRLDFSIILDQETKN